MITGCSGTPSAADGKQAILDKIKAESDGRIELVSFEKTNGMQGEEAGVKTYALEFEAEITFLDNCKWSTGLIRGDGGMSFHTFKISGNPNSPMAMMENAMNGPGADVKKGESFNVSGVIHLLSKERGWSVERIDLKVAKRMASGIEGDMQRVSRAMRTDGKDAAKIESTKSEIKIFATVLDAYELDMGHYPTEAEGGLKALLVEPAGGSGGWHGPYLRGTTFKDLWGHDYLYKFPGTHNQRAFDVSSVGPDGNPDTQDDIGNW